MTADPTVRAVIVDDSTTARALLRAVLDSDPLIEVVAEAASGREAIEIVDRHRPSVVVMDIVMPDMDGFAATQEIMARTPTPIVLVTAGHGMDDVSRSMRALQAGALTVLAKPSGPSSRRHRREAAHFRDVVRALADVKVVGRRHGHRQQPRAAQTRMPAAAVSVQAVGVVASTGGPPAVQRFLRALPAEFAAPILIVQHISDGFVAGLARWLSAETGREVRIARDGQPPVPSVAYLAPDGVHLRVGPGPVLQLSADAAVGGFRPSGDVLLSAMAAEYGAAAAAVVFTGMGVDGLTGARAVHAVGGMVLAQDEASAAVYGMPRAVAEAGIAHAIGAVDELAYRLAQTVSIVGRR